MRGTIALVAVSVLAALAVPAAPVIGTRAYAAEPSPPSPPSPPSSPPSADLRMTYGHPEISRDGSGVTWHWVLTNTGAAGAETVVATHRVSADQKIAGISRACAAGSGDIVCRFGLIKPGERRTGWIRTSVLKAGGTLRVSAQVTWRESLAARPGGGDPATTGAGDAAAPPGTPPVTGSWGVSGTDAATDVPAQNV